MAGKPGNLFGLALPNRLSNHKGNSMEDDKKPPLHQKFEHAVTAILAVLISIMVLAALWGLIIEIYHLVLHSASNRLDHQAFQSVFSMILTLLIALEFSHSIVHPSSRSSGVIKARAIVLIAILAVSRQFIVFELQTDSATILAALAISLLALGVVYRLIRDQG